MNLLFGRYGVLCEGKMGYGGHYAVFEQLIIIPYFSF